MKFPWVKSAMLGIDIQPDAIRLAQLQRIRHGYSLQQLKAIPFTETVMEEGKIKHFEKLADILYQTVEELGVQGLPAALSVPGSLVRTKKMFLPKSLTGDALNTEVLAHIYRELPGLSGSLNFDYQIISDEKNLQEVHCVAVREDYLSRLTSAVTSAGIDIKIVDVDFYALQRIIWHALGLSKKTTAIAVMCCLKNYVLFSVYNQADVDFVQSWYVPRLDEFIQQIPVVFGNFKYKEELQLCKQLVIVASVKHRKEIKEKMSRIFSWQIDYIEQFHFLNANESQETMQFQNQIEFIYAIGLAMRESPLW